MIQVLPKVGLIGVGNMGGAIVRGLCAANYPASQIYLYDHKPPHLSAWHNQYGINIATTIDALAEQCAMIILAVKPALIKDTLQHLQPHHTTQLVLSVAAGVSCQMMAQQLPKAAIIRAMPNTPIQVGCGMTALYANDLCTLQHQQWADYIFSQIGQVLWLKQETQMSAVVALSGSGPAYFFHMMEGMIQTGIDLGLSEEEAKQLTLQTALGAAQLANQSTVSPATLRQQVTSPNGTTAKAIQTLQSLEWNLHLAKAMQACAARNEEIAADLRQNF